MAYITQRSLMLESEQAVRAHAHSADAIPRRICTQLIQDWASYSHWHSWHETAMSAVAIRRHRDSQLLTLRRLAVEHVHRTALVNYLRDYRVVGEARDRTLRVFHGISDVRNAVLSEHRNYLVAASSQLCAFDLLGLMGDAHGAALVRSYEFAYGQYFALFCDQARAAQRGKQSVLALLLPDVKALADGMRLKIFDRRLSPARRASPAGRPQSFLQERRIVADRRAAPTIQLSRP